MDSPRFMNLIRYWWTFCIVAAITFLCGFLEPHLGYRTIGFIFLLGVLAVGSINSLGPVLFSAALSAAAWNFFFIPPKFTFAISQPEDLILCVCFFVAAVITGTLTSQARQQGSLAVEREARTLFLYEVLQDILQSTKPEEFLSRIAMRVEDLLGGKLKILLDETNNSADNKSLNFPIRGRGRQIGIMIYENGADALTSEQRTLLESVAQQIGLSIERLRLEKRLRETERLEQSERLHQTLLNSISHELRTPLTALIGFATALEDDSATGTKENRKALAEGLGQACDRLNRVISNLLDMSRLNSESFGIQKEWHDVSDLVGVVLKDLRESLKNHQVAVHLGESLPLVEIDFRLMQHALANIILNAAAYSPRGSTIDISAVVTGKDLNLNVNDQGPGIPADSLTKVFDKFYRVPGTPPGGTGLGLSIVKSIVEFHQGNITAGSSTNGHGARLSITLPLGTPPTAPEARHE